MNILGNIAQGHINPCKANAPFLYPLITFGFLRFSGGIEMEHWAKMG